MSHNNEMNYRWSWLMSQCPTFIEKIVEGKVGFIAMEDDPGQRRLKPGKTLGDKIMRLKNTLGLAIHFTPPQASVDTPYLYMKAGAAEKAVDDTYVALTENQLVVGGKVIHRLQPTMQMDLTDYLDAQPVWDNILDARRMAKRLMMQKENGVSGMDSGGFKRGKHYFVTSDHDGDSALKKSQANRHGYLAVSEPKKTESWATQAVIDYNRKWPYRFTASNGVTYTLSDATGDRGVCVPVKP